MGSEMCIRDRLVSFRKTVSLFESDIFVTLDCRNIHHNDALCDGYAANGECATHPQAWKCRRSCGTCGPNGGFLRQKHILICHTNCLCLQIVSTRVTTVIKNQKKDVI